MKCISETGTYYTDILEVLRAHLWGRAPDPGPGFHSLAGWLALYARAPSDAIVEALADRYGIIDTAPKNDVLDLRDVLHRATGSWSDRLTSALYRRVEDFPPSLPGAQVVRWVERRYYRALAYPQALYYQDGSTDLRADSLPYHAAEHVAQLVVTEQHRWSPVEYQRAHQRAVQLSVDARARHRRGPGQQLQVRIALVSSAGISPTCGRFRRPALTTKRAWTRPGVDYRATERQRGDAAVGAQVTIRPAVIPRPRMNAHPLRSQQCPAH